MLHETDGSPQARQAYLPHVDAVDAHAALVDVVEARKQRAGSRLASARRPDKRNSLPRLDMQAETFEGRGILAIGEMDVVEVDTAACDLEIGSACLLAHVDRTVHYLAEAPESGSSLLEDLGEVDERLDGRGKNANVEGEYRKVRSRDLPECNPVAAKHDDNRVQHARERRAHGVEESHGLVCRGLRRKVGIVGCSKSGTLVIFSNERLDGAHTLQGVFQL